MTDYAPAAAPLEPAKPKKGQLSKAEAEKILEEARRRMKRGLELDQPDRIRAEKELRFVWNKDNCQWDDEAKKARKDRPMLTENRNPSFVKQASNEIRRSRPQIRVLPVDDKSDPFTAFVMEGLIRNIEANSRADMCYDEGTNLAGYCGRGYWKVTTAFRGEGFSQEIEIHPVPDPFSIVDDPDCAYPDKSDRKWAFEVEKVPRDEYEAQYKTEPASFEEATRALGDYAANWCSEKEIVVANYWRVVEEKETIYLMTDGQVTKDPAAYARQVLMTNALLLPPTVEDQREITKRKVEWYCVDGMTVHSKGDWAGEYIPLCYTTCEQMKLDGAWHTKGMTYDGQDLTKANNYLLSAQVENIALTPKRPVIGPTGAFVTDNTKWNSINTEAHAYVQFDTMDEAGQPITMAPQRMPGGDVNPEIANVRMGVIDGQRAVVGLMGASMGDRGPEVSGIGINARKTEGDTAIFHIADNTVRAVRYTGMVIADLIPKVYRRAQVVRILNTDSQPIMQAINKLYVDDKGQQRFVNFSEGKFDISVSAGPAFETHRQSENALLVDLAGKIPQMATAAPDLIAKRLMTSGDGQEIAQRLARTVPAEIRGEAPPPEVQQMQQQLQQAEAQMKQMGMAKDFAESELAKQRSLVQKAELDTQRAGIEKDKKMVELEGALAKAQIEKEKAELALQRAQIEALRAAMPAPVSPFAGVPAQ